MVIPRWNGMSNETSKKINFLYTRLVQSKHKLNIPSPLYILPLITNQFQEFTCMKSSIDVIYAHSDEYCMHTNAIRDKRTEAPNSMWRPASECFYNCITPGTGIRLVEKKQCSSCNATVNVQTCQHSQVHICCAFLRFVT